MKTAKQEIKKKLIRGINSLGFSSVILGSPKGYISAKEWCTKNADKQGVSFIPVYNAVTHKTNSPVTLDSAVHKLFQDLATWTEHDAFVALIPKARVWGRSGAVITPDDLLLGDVSREFGKYGGIFNEEHSIFKQLRLNRIKNIKGTVAVVAGAGSYNYHHWMYDVLPRFHLLQQSGLLKEIDYFIVDYTGLKFQKDSLQVLGIDAGRIIPSNDAWKFHVSADLLVIPSLPSRLGTISKWVVDFLRNTFLTNKNDLAGSNILNLYIGRKKAPTRKLLNEKEVLDHLQFLQVKELLAEDCTIEETAALFNNASFIIGVHGSGLSNLVFCRQGVKVIDIVAPKHIDPYYWLLTDYSGGVYGYLYGEGERPDEKTDLVHLKTDENIYLDIDNIQKMTHLLNIEGIQVEQKG